ncbi:SirB2 family protein [Lysobacter sp. A3-1-A15]|uniref:SirB2 family protein n=1 Tax=Novilysobacter viscosus TaxID=3098602 RepID=UPI002ED7E448
MIEFYPQIKHVHIMMAVASGLLFALRGGASLAGMRWPQWTAVRWTSYGIDTTLLTAALMLLTILPGALFSNGWLAAKLVLLVVYVVFGVLALRRGRTRGARAGFYVAALATFGMVYSIARAHHPLGFGHGLLG